ncbi:hypothetical protein AMST5_00974 [freshwater sediment metagenome]|uniref:Stress-induced protein n=1 Tax=freshwater sediment metagenome TaxID=556182 RepID=A0AA48RA67_9ZZZZ
MTTFELPSYQLPKARKSRRGFASMDPERLRAIAIRGGKNVAAKDRSFSRDHALAAAAGRKGGVAVKPENRGFAKNRELAVSAGRKGGKAEQPHAPRGR